MNEKLINLTPHEITILDTEGKIIRVIPPTSPAARVTSREEKRLPIDGVPFVETIFGKVENLPDEEPGVFLIVSQIVIAACPGRNDLIRPDTGPTCLRDAAGKIVGVRQLTY